MTAVKKFPHVRSAYDFDTSEYDPGTTMVYGPTLTKQSFKDECDINMIMARYEKTGVIDHLAHGVPEYGDFASVPEYHSAMNTVVEADMLFAALDARTRDRFGNDPVQMLAFLGDPGNREEAIKLGLVQAPVEPAPPTRVEVVNPPPVVPDPSGSKGP